MPEIKWKRLDDDCIRQIWQCDFCKKISIVDPSSYANLGTPICFGKSECEGEDMAYLYTEIKEKLNGKRKKNK